MKTKITEADILPLDVFSNIRSEKRREILDIKKNRRVPLGPDVTIYFENYQTLLWQIHEMLYIEKGGDEQIQDELTAYNPLVPQGQELVATVMIEIDNPQRRSEALSQLGHFENSLVMRFGPHTIHGKPEEDLDRTNEKGKTSSVHFIHWPMTQEQIQTFCQPGNDVIIECTHPKYSQKTILPEAVRLSLSGDFEKSITTV